MLPGDDDITYEHVRFSGELLVKKLVILYNKIVELERPTHKLTDLTH